MTTPPPTPATPAQGTAPAPAAPDAPAPSSAPRTAELLGRADALEDALERGGTAAAEAAEVVRVCLAQARERLALGVDHTVVALAGGTGSGKSSLFNALSGLLFADVGVRRPTTSEVTACVWAHDATALLDWLGVAPERRIERESLLDGQSQAELRGLVLLDLPDHDSVEPEHREVVDRVLPQVDVLVWVVDPQKYADDALHSGYLRHLVGHEASMHVALNQVDTVRPGAVDELLVDVSRLLSEDGLEGVPVHAVSARTGAGVGALRDALAAAVRRPGVAETRVRAVLGDAARALRATVALAEPSAGGLGEASAVTGLAEAVGLDGATTALRSAAPDEPLEPAGPPQPERVAAVRRSWLKTVGAELPAPWRARLDEVVADEDTLVSACAAVAATPAAPESARVPRNLGTAALVTSSLAAVALVLGGLVSAEVLGLAAGAVPFVLAGAFLALAAVGLSVLAVVRRRALSAGRAEQWTREVRTGLEQTVRTLLVEPTATVLDDHRAVRKAATAQGWTRPQVSTAD